MMELNPDFGDLLSAFDDRKVRFLLVGGYALSFYGRPRTTGDLDLWVEPTVENASRVLSALEEFGAPLADLTVEDLVTPGLVFQIGVAPHRIDILTSLTSLRFETSWRRRRRARYGRTPISVLSESDFVKNKRALGRTRDLADAEEIAPLVRKKRKPRR